MRGILIIILSSILILLLALILIWSKYLRNVKDEEYNGYYKRFNNRNIKVTLFDIILQRYVKRLSK